MTYQAYLDNIRTKTGKTPDDFRVLAAERGLTTYRDLMAWLKADYGLGHGHANLIAQLITTANEAKKSADEKIDARFSGNKAHWRMAYDAIIAAASQFGPDFKVMPTSSYISLVRGGKKFAIVDPATADRLDTASHTWAGLLVDATVRHTAEIGRYGYYAPYLWSPEVA